MNDKFKVVIIGATLPSMGGVEIHIARMMDILKENGIDYEQIDPRCCIDAPKGLRQLKFYMTLLKASGTLYHFHTSHIISLWVFMALLSLIGKKVIYTLHNENIADEIENKVIGFMKYLSLKICFKRYSHIICVNQRMKDTLVSIGFNHRKISLIPAFIPQSIIDPSTIPNNIKEFIDTHSPTITGYACSIYNYQGVDRYGVDMMIDVVDRLKKKFPNIGLILSIPNPDDENLQKIEVYKEDIKKRKIEKNIHICIINIDLTSLFQITDVYIRPSTTDGDPVAIREALYINVPTVSSDRTWKPDGTILHRDRDAEDFKKMVEYALNNLKEEHEKLKRIAKPEFGMDILHLYKSLCGK